MKEYLLKSISLCLLILFIFSGCQNDGAKQAEPSTVPGVGSVDQVVILNLPPFIEAEKKFEEKRKELIAEYSKIMKDIKDDKSKEIIYKEFEDELSQARLGLLNPIMEKEKSIIEKVAKEEGLSVVVDETLVVYGVEDITDKVSKGFEDDKKDEQEDKTPSEQTKEAPNQVIGYMSQDKLYELPKMKEVEKSFNDYYMELNQQIQKETKDIKDNAAKSKILSNYQKKLQQKKEEMFKPVKDEVNKIADEIAKSKGLILILDKADIFYGGLDITDDVIKKLKQ